MLNNIIQYCWQKFLSITHYNHFQWSDFVLFLAVPIGCLVVEAIIVGYRSSSLKKLLTWNASAQNDFLCFLTHAFNLYQFIGIALTFGLFYFAYGVIQKHFCLHLIDYITNPFLQFGLMLFVGDFKNYFRHYLLHRFGWSWELHKLHHSATDFTMLTYLRSHAAETILTNFIDLFPFIIFGAGFQSFVWVYVFREAHQYFIHSQIKSDWGWLGKCILVSPLAHRIHHSINTVHYGKNFGNTFIIWDRLFGTYCEANPETVDVLGIPENPYNQKGFLHDYLFCYVRSIQSVFNFKS
jgi:sterol desaturase/sphingolipid hydroxylase (fatty acid hydroxylase superfamily)